MSVVKNFVAGMLHRNDSSQPASPFEKNQNELETYFKLFLEAIPDAMLIINRDGKMMLANSQIEKMFGYHLNEFLGKEIELLLSERSRKSYAELFAMYFQNPKPRAMNHGTELIGRRRDDSEFPIEIRLSPLKTENDLWMMVAIRDMTPQKMAEEHLKELVTNLEQSNRELDKFAHIASHDLQEPLRMVSSYMQLLAKRYKDKLDPEANEFIEFAVDGAKRMQLLITDLLAYSRVSTKVKPFKPTNCQTILEHVLNNLRITLDETHAEVTHDRLPTLNADPTLLLQLFQNLISNAIKFNHQQPPTIHIAATQEKNGTWLFTIADNGIGIAPEFHDRIFLIFQRLNKKDFPGTGVGLAICKKIVEQHHGKIWVDSKLDEGATFCFTIQT